MKFLNRPLLRLAAIAVNLVLLMIARAFQGLPTLGFQTPVENALIVIGIAAYITSGAAHSLTGYLAHALKYGIFSAVGGALFLMSSDYKLNFSYGVILWVWLMSLLMITFSFRITDSMIRRILPLFRPKSSS